MGSQMLTLYYYVTATLQQRQAAITVQWVVGQCSASYEQTLITLTDVLLKSLHKVTDADEKKLLTQF